MKKTLLLTAIILGTSTSAQALSLNELLPLSHDGEEPREQTQLIVTRHSPSDIINEVHRNGRVVSAWGNHEVLRLEAGRAEAVKALLERLPGVKSVEEDAVVSVLAPDSTESQGLLFGDSEDGSDSGSDGGTDSDSGSDSDSDSGSDSDTGSNDDSDTDSTSGYNDPGYGEQYHWRDRTSSLKGASSIEAARAKATQEERLSIAFIDTGYQHHSDFQWAGGYNFWDQDSEGPQQGPDYATWPDYPDCNQNHGQLVGSILGAPQNSGTGITGMLEADYYGVRVAGCNGSGTLSAMAKGIRWAAGDTSLSEPAIDRPARIINISMAAFMGSRTCPGYLQEAIDFARNKGGIVVASAGNDPNVPGEEVAPANCRGVIAVGAVDRYGDKADFSTSGSNLAYSALGRFVPVQDHQDYFTASGTSFSAPIVSGILAILWETVPELTASEIVQFSLDSTTAFGDTQGKEMGRGVLNNLILLEKAVASVFQPELQVVHPLTNECNSQLIADYHGEQLNVQDLREILLSDERMADNRYAVIFSVPEDKALRTFNGRIETARPSRRFVLQEWDKNRQHGLQICDRADGTGCDSDHLTDLKLADVKSFDCDS